MSAASPNKTKQDKGKDSEIITVFMTMIKQVHIVVLKFTSKQLPTIVGLKLNIPMLTLITLYKLKSDPHYSQNSGHLSIKQPVDQHVINISRV